jgi:hypothetical protein
MNDSKQRLRNGSGARATPGPDQIWEDRKALAKKEQAAESAANDAKTARLRALRLEKEKQDAVEAAANPPPPPAPKKRAVRRIVAE